MPYFAPGACARLFTFDPIGGGSRGESWAGNTGHYRRFLGYSDGHLRGVIHEACFSLPAHAKESGYCSAPFLCSSYRLDTIEVLSGNYCGIMDCFYHHGFGVVLCLEGREKETISPSASYQYRYTKTVRAYSSSASLWRSDAGKMVPHDA
jgi:hypothetical protein